MSRLRLAAASAIVKLAQEPCYHEIITLEQYQLCALAINVRKWKRKDIWGGKLGLYIKVCPASGTQGDLQHVQYSALKIDKMH